MNKKNLYYEGQELSILKQMNYIYIYKVTLKLKGYKGTWNMFPNLNRIDLDENISKLVLDGKEIPKLNYITFNENKNYILEVYFSIPEMWSNYFDYNPFIEEAIIHQGITKMTYNFRWCHELKKVYISNTVKIIDSCFNECPILKEVIFEENSLLLKIINTCFCGTEIDTLKLPDSVVDISGICNDNYFGDESSYKGIKHLKSSKKQEYYPSNIDKKLLELDVPKTPKSGMYRSSILDLNFYNKLTYKGNEDYERLYPSLHLFWDSPAKIVALKHCKILEFGNNAKTESIKLVKSLIIKNIPKTLQKIEFDNSYIQYFDFPSQLTIQGYSNLNEHAKYLKFNGNTDWSLFTRFFTLELGKDVTEFKVLNIPNQMASYIKETDRHTLIIPNSNLSKILITDLPYYISVLYLPDSLEEINNPNYNGQMVYTLDHNTTVQPLSIYFPKNLKINNLSLRYLERTQNPIVVFNSIPQTLSSSSIIPSSWISDNNTIDWMIFVPEGTTDGDKYSILKGGNPTILENHFDTFIWDNDVLYSSDRKTLLRYNKNKKSFTVPNTITRIISTAFPWLNNLEVVNIPASVLAIDPAAFYCCKNIKKFNVDPDNEYFCSVNGILYTKDMTELVCYPPAKDSTVYEVPETVTYLRHMSLFYAYNIKKFISKSIQYIQHGVFSPQMNIEDLELYNIDTISTIFAGWEKLKNVKIITDYVLNFGRSGNFVGCSSLEYVYIKCKNVLVNVYEYGHTSPAFTGCYNLKLLELDYDYVNYSSNGLEYIFTDAPCKKIICPRLDKFKNSYVEELIITGDSMGSPDCCGSFNNLKDLYFPNITTTTTGSQMKYYWSPTVHIENNYEISSGTGMVNIQIEDENYDKQLELWYINNESFDVPKKVKHLGFGIPSYSIHEINIPKDSELEYFGLSNSTYNGLTYSRKIEKIYIPKNLSQLSISYTLGACQVLDFEVDPENTNFRMIGDFLLNSEGKVIWLRPGITETIVPKEVKELTISNLNVTFEENSLLTKLNISKYNGENLIVPESVTSLTISNCPNLNNINFGENLTSLSVDTCPKLNTINLNEGLTSLNVNSCSELNNVNFHEGLTSLTTRNCPKLDVIVPESVTSYTISDCKSVEFKNMIPFGKKTTSYPSSNNQIKIVDGTIIKVPSCTIDEWKTLLGYDGITIGSECYTKETENGTVCEDGKEYTNIRKEISKNNVDYTYLREYKGTLILENSENCPQITAPSNATNLGDDKYRISINGATYSFTINTSDKIDSLNMDWTVINSSSYGSVLGTIEYKIDDGEYTSISFRDKNSETISNLGGSSHVITVLIKHKPVGNTYYSGTMTISFTK